MVWVRLDDGFTRHPRMVAAGLHGRALFIAGLCYCGTHLTDGMIPKAGVPMLCAEAGVPTKTWQKLVDVGSWIDKQDHFEVHDFLVYNPPRAKILAERAAGAERQRKSRESRSESRRDNQRTNGESPPDPTRPDSLSIARRVDEACMVLIERDVERVEDKRDVRAVRAACRRERREDGTLGILNELANTNPDATAVELADLVEGLAPCEEAKPRTDAYCSECDAVGDHFTPDHFLSAAAG